MIKAASENLYYDSITNASFWVYSIKAQFKIISLQGIDSLAWKRNSQWTCNFTVCM